MKRSKKFIPQKQQIEAVEYLKKTKHKGLLIYHTIGSGKTCTSIMFADQMIEMSKERVVRVFSPATLRENFVEEYCRTCGADEAILKKNYIFYSYNYSSILNLLPLTLDDSLIIVDEAHRLINGKRNGSMVAVEIYRLIYHAKNSIVLLLTATPLSKIIDLPLYVYLLKESRASEKVADDDTIFEGVTFMKNIEYEEDADSVLIYSPIDADIIMNMLKGIVSYYAAPQDEHYPVRIDMPHQIVQMSDQQMGAYQQAMKWETLQVKPEDSLKIQNPEYYKIRMGLWQIAHKYLLSRSTSNFLYPTTVEIGSAMYGFNIPAELADIPIHRLKKLLNDPYTAKTVMQFLESTTPDRSGGQILSKLSLPTLADATVDKGGWVNDEVFEPYKLSGIYSPKMYKVATNVAENLDGKHVIYSVLKTRGGVNIMRAILELCGLSTLVYSGDIRSDKERATILDKFNSPKDNLRGERYQVLLITEAGSEGLTFKDVKYFHVMESDTKESKIQQVIGRAIRYDSHTDLPRDERFVKVYRYFSSKGREEGIDMRLYRMAKAKQDNMNVFLKMLIDSSVT